MKTLLIVFCSLLSLQIGIAQMTFSPEIYDIDLTIETEKKFGFILDNNTDTAFTFYWSLDFPDGFPKEWTLQVCDTKTCYDFGVFKTPDSNPNILEPGQKTEPNSTYVNVKSNDVPGKSYIIFNVYTLPGCEGLIYSTQANPTSTDEEPLRPVIIYPNPSSDQMMIKNDDGLTAVKITSIDGKSVYSSPHTKGMVHDINHIANGTYVVSLFGIDNQLTRIQQLIIH